MLLNIIDRLEFFRKSVNIGQNELCAKINYSSGAYTNAKKRKTDLVSTTIENINIAFPQLNIEWLISGSGEMLKDAPAVVIEDSKEYRELERKYVACLEQKNIHEPVVQVTSKTKLNKTSSNKN